MVKLQLFLILVLGVAGGLSLKCYIDSSDNGSIERECPTGMNACSKTTHSNGRALYNCIYSADTKDRCTKGQAPSATFENPLGESLEFCYCFTDLCNSALIPQGGSLLIMILLAALLI